MDLLADLMASTVRAGFVRWLVGEAKPTTVSALAHKLGFTPRAVRLEVERFAKTGAVTLAAVGASDVVRVEPANDLVRALKALVRASRATSAPTPEGVRDALAGYGAPLAGAVPTRDLTLEETVVAGLAAARTDATVLRTLPVVLVRNLLALRWETLFELARERKLKRELGFLLDLTAELTRRPELSRLANELRDARVSTPRYFPEPKTEADRKLARRNTPPAAHRWKLLMNMPEEAFRSMLGKHVAAISS